MKKNTSIIKTLTSRSFKADRARNLAAVLAIVLTTLMFTSLFILSQSMAANMQQMNFQQAGYDSHLSSSLLTDEEAEKIISHEAVRDYGKTIVAGVAENEELSGRQVEIRYADESYAASAFSLPTVGSMPQNAGEIALDTITLNKLGLPYEVGQEIRLKWRKDLSAADDTVSTFTLSGYWAGNSAAMASMAWVSEDFIQKEGGAVNQEQQRAGGQVFGMVQLHVNLYDDGDLEGAAQQILSDTKTAGASLTPNMAYDASMRQNIFREIIPMLLGAVLVFASGYLIIYNIFQISVAADIRFYGRLKTLGASRRQLKKIIYGQAGRLCLAGIPVGLLLGVLLGAVLVPLVIAGTGAAATVSVNPLVCIGSAVFALLTVLLSCRKPAKIAGKVSPVEALRYTDAAANYKKKTKKRSKGAGLPQMALANLGRNKKRTFIVICSLTLGLVLLTAVHAKNASFDIEKYMGQTVISDFEVKERSIATNFGTYDPYGTTISDDLMKKIDNLQGLERVGHLYAQVFTHEIGTSALRNIQTYYNTGDRLAYIEATDKGLAQSYQDMVESGTCTAVLYGIDGLVLDAFSDEYRILDGSFDKELFLSGRYCLAQAAPDAENMAPETQPTYSAGDAVTIGGQTFTVMAVAAEIPTVTEGVNNTEADFISLYLPADTFRECYPDNTVRKIFFDVEDAYRAQAEQMLTGYKDREGRGVPFQSKTTLIQHYNEQTRASTVMAFSISIIIALVGILNFINSMVTAIVSRRKEFAVMQSIGMTKRQLRTMLIFEGLYYAVSTLLASYVFGALAVGTVVRAMTAGDWTATYHFTVMPLVLCTPVLLCFAALIPWLCFKNLEKQSIVERL